MGWTKYFIDGSSISEPKSWSKTKSSGIYRTTLKHENKTISITNLGGIFWQSDTYIADLKAGVSQPVMVERRIECEIEEPDIDLYIHENNNDLIIYFGLSVDSRSVPFRLDVHNRIGQWFVAEIDLKTSKFKYYFSPERI